MSLDYLRRIRCNYLPGRVKPEMRTAVVDFMNARAVIGSSVPCVRRSDKRWEYEGAEIFFEFCRRRSHFRQRQITELGVD